jgi:hypothetical protein
MPETPLRQTGEPCASAAGAATSAARRLNERLDEAISVLMRGTPLCCRSDAVTHAQRSLAAIVPDSKVRKAESG